MSYFCYALALFHIAMQSPIKIDVEIVIPCVSYKVGDILDFFVQIISARTDLALTKLQKHTLV